MWVDDEDADRVGEGRKERKGKIYRKYVKMSQDKQRELHNQ